MAKLFIGIDGGGSHTRACVIDQTSRVIAISTGGPTNIHSMADEQILNNLNEVIESAIFGLNSTLINGCLAMAGVNYQSDIKHWQRLIAQDRKLISLFNHFPRIINDSQAALRSGTTNADGIVIISGTGSNCYGRNNKGQEYSCGGQDYILSDQGSGYQIGLSILKSVTEDLDGRGPETILTHKIFKKTNIKSLEQLSRMVYSKPWGKTEIADVESIFAEALTQEDPVAKAILDQATSDLVLMVKTVANNLQLKEKEFDLVTSGSVLEKNKILHKTFVAKVKQLFPKTRVIKPKISAAQAAAILAQTEFILN